MFVARHSPFRQGSAGFTLIEVMTGILIMAAAAATLFYGVSYARAESRRTIMKQRALEELRSEMDYWVARILDGQIADHELPGDSQGKEVLLYNPDAMEEDQEFFPATIYREPMDQGANSAYDPSGDSPYYHLECYIQWEDHLGDVNGEPLELRMECKVFTK